MISLAGAAECQFRPVGGGGGGSMHTVEFWLDRRELLEFVGEHYGRRKEGKE